jgi:hypothetical protein
VPVNSWSSTGVVIDTDWSVGETVISRSITTANQSDFYCVRLNTETGELMLINLQKVESFP